ncbi:MAG TPA: hypothetical protein VIM75_04590 [Ohtaekwangia sp.]
MKVVFKYFVWAFCMQAITLYAQDNARNAPPEDTGMDPLKARADIIPHSPEVEAMAKYGVLPVTQYTGMPQISVPIFELKASGLTIPFALSYNYNGFKPLETATWCGLGWNLQGGGSIVKIIKGQLDDTRNPGSNYDDLVYPTAMTWSQPFCYNVALGQIDAESDIYIFNIGQYSGKFILIKGEAHLFPFQNIKIRSTATGFKMIDDKGNIYLFDDTETTFTKGSEIPVHTSSWQISKIITADRKDTISYLYSDYSFRQPSTFTDRCVIDSRNYTGQSSSGETFSRAYAEGDHINAKVLSTVISRYGTISFMGSSEERLDIVAGEGAKALDRVSVRGPQGSSFQKDIVLVHGYFGGNSKLKLKEVYEMRYDNSSEFATPVTDQHYKFEYYNEGNSLSTDLADGVDYWGYYNGANNTNLFPKDKNLFYGAAADRNANISYSIRGMIKSIEYPTGGRSTFDFEQNQSGKRYVTSNFTAASIESDVSFDSNNQKNGYTEVFKSFTLNKAQVVHFNYGDLDENKNPTRPVVRIYKDRTTSPPVYTSPVYTSGGENLTGSQFLEEGKYFFSVSSEPGLVGIDGTFTTYGILNYDDYQVINTLADGPGLRIKQISSYSNGSTIPAFIKQYSYNDGVELMKTALTTGSNLSHNCAGYYNSSYVASVRSALSDLAESQFYYREVTESTQDNTRTGKTVYTFGTESSQLLDVKQLSQTDYKYTGSGFVPVRASASQYQLTIKEAFTGFTVNKAVTVLPADYSTRLEYCSQLVSPDVTQPSLLMDIYEVSDPYTLTSDYTQIKNTKETVYSDDGSATYTSESNYFYDNASHIYPTRIVTSNSKGEQITQELKYALDYNFGTCSLPATIDTNFQNDMQSAMGVLNASLANLINALAPYQPYEKKYLTDSNGNFIDKNGHPVDKDHPLVDITQSNRQTFTSVANQYNHCQADFQSAVSTAITNRNNALNAYSSCLNTTIANSSLTGWQQAIAWMQLNNVVSPVIEKYMSIKKSDGNEYLLLATRNEYGILNAKSAEVVSIKQTETVGGLLKTSFLADVESNYKAQLTFTYDQDLNLVSQQRKDDAPIVYLYGYKQNYPVAEIRNATFTQVLTALGMTASQYRTESQASSPSANYLSKINALRQNLKGSLLTVYLHNPLIGITSMSDANNVTTYYEYDVLGRLKFVKDGNQDIVKKYEYHYKDQE